MGLIKPPLLAQPLFRGLLRLLNTRKKQLSYMRLWQPSNRLKYQKWTFQRPLRNITLLSRLKLRQKWNVRHSSPLQLKQNWPPPVSVLPLLNVKKPLPLKKWLQNVLNLKRWCKRQLQNRQQPYRKKLLLKVRLRAVQPSERRNFKNKKTRLFLRQEPWKRRKHLRRLSQLKIVRLRQ